MNAAAMTAITRDSRRLWYSVMRRSGPVRDAMKVAALAMLTLAIGLCAMPVRADTLMRVTVRESDGSPAAGVAVTVRQAVGDGATSPALVGAAATDSDGVVSFHFTGVQPSDVYRISADDRRRGRHAAVVVSALDGREAAA